MHHVMLAVTLTCNLLHSTLGLSNYQGTTVLVFATFKKITFHVLIYLITTYSKLLWLVR